jgi:hypothetical protein
MFKKILLYEQFICKYVVGDLSKELLPCGTKVVTKEYTEVVT